jgi:tetratricopeptide (TPR) repeat protein
VAGERAAAQPRLALAGLVAELAVAHERLDVLAPGDDDTTAVRTVFSWSYHALKPEAARLFRLVGVHPGAELSGGAAAALSGVPPGRVRPHLDALAAGHLLAPTGGGRYRCHDLLRVYAAECAAVDEPAGVRSAALARVLDWYLHSADAADRLLIPQRRRPPLDPVAAGVTPVSFAGAADALAWCEAERANLVAVTRAAADAGLDRVAWRLPVALWGFFMLRKYRADWISTTELGLGAARRAGDRSGEAWTLTCLGLAYWDEWRFDEAMPYLRQALDIRRETGDRAGEGSALAALAANYRDLRRFDEAVDHYAQALAISRETQDRWGEAIALAGLGASHAALDRYEEAVVHLEQSVVASRAVGDRWSEGLALENLGAAYRHRHRLGESVDRLREALAIRRGIGDRWGEAMALMGLGASLRAVGDVAGARDAWRAALPIFDRLNDPQAAQVRSLLAGLDAA